MTAPQHPDPFDDDLRHALRREAPGPAPDRLVARIAASRRGAPNGAMGRSLLPARGPSLRSWGAALGTVAAAIVIVAALALRPSGGTGPTVGGPTASAPSSGGIATIAPSSAPSSVAPSSAPTPAGPAAIGSIPADFDPVSVTFVSTDAGWLLGSGPCGAGSGSGTGSTCAAIARTTDGGRTWQLIPAPPTALAQAPAANAGVSGLRFADALDGWAFGPELWATHDGGATWQRAALPVSSPTVLALEASAGGVHAAYFDSAEPGTIRIATSQVATDSWAVSSLRVQLGAGPVPQPQIVLHGSVGWLLEVDRTVVGGARLAGGQWTSWTPPCLTVNGPASLGASSDANLVAACNVGVWATPAGVHLYASSDTGTSFRAVGGRLSVTDLQGIAAAPASSTVVVAGRIGGGTALVASFDGGTSWTTVLPAIAGASISGLGFTSADQGVAIATHEVGTSQLLMTRDGGRTWQIVGLGS